MVDASYPPPGDPPPMQPVQTAAIDQAQQFSGALAPPAPAQPDFSRGDALLAGAGHPLSQNTSMLDQKQAAAQRAGQEYQQAAAGAPKPPQGRQQPQEGMGLEAAGSWVMVATALGAIAGAMTRRSSTNALAAFTGALEGVQQGNKQAFEQNKVKWEQENKSINQQLQQQRDAYLDILNSKKINFDMKMMELQQEAARQHDDVMAQQAQRRDMITIAGLLDKREQLRVKGVEDYQKMDNALKVAQVRAGGATGARQLDDAAIQAKVDQMKAGIPAAQIMRGLGRADIAEINNKFAGAGGSAEDMVQAQQGYTRGQAQARVGGAMEQRIETAAGEVEQFAPLAIQSSENLPRGQFVPLNRLKQMGQAAMSNPQYNDFLVKNISLAKAYGRAMNPQGVPRVSEQMEAKAEGLLDKAISREAYVVQVKALQQEVAATRKAIAGTRPGGAQQKPGEAGWQELAPGIRFREIGAP